MEARTQSIWKTFRDNRLIQILRRAKARYGY